MGVRLYCVTSRTTGKIYIGITKRPLDKRWKAHVYTATRAPGKYSRLHRAIVKYGAGDFDVVELFHYSTAEGAMQAEIDLIAALDLTRVGYNVALGGYLGQGAGRRRTGQALENLRAGARKRAADPAWRQRMREVALERAKNPEYVAKLSAALTGKRHSDKTKALIREKRALQITTDETRRKMSESRRGRSLPPRTAEQRRHMSEIKLKYWAARRAAEISPGV